MAERQLNARGLYGLTTGIVDVQTPQDLVQHDIQVSNQAIESTWGQEGMEMYQRALEAKISKIQQMHIETQTYMGD